MRYQSLIDFGFMDWLLRKVFRFKAGSRARELRDRRNFVILSLSSGRISHSAGLEEATHHAMDCFFSTSFGPLADTTMGYGNFPPAVDIPRRTRHILFRLSARRSRRRAMPQFQGASMKPKSSAKPLKILVIDVGGTNVKMLATGQKEPRRFPSGPTMTPASMVKQVKEATKVWEYDRISLGYPGPIINGHPLREPHNLGNGWMAFNFSKAFGLPVKIINDASMQALGSYEGGHMLFLGLGTGLGSAMIVDGFLQPMELAHLLYKKGKTYEDYLGLRGLERLGKKKWRRHVAKVAERLKDAVAADYVVLGGGNSKKLDSLPAGARLGKNENAFLGGFRMWKE
jgi:polyphosphate glucokinase